MKITKIIEDLDFASFGFGMPLPPPPQTKVSSFNTFLSRAHVLPSCGFLQSLEQRVVPGPKHEVAADQIQTSIESTILSMGHSIRSFPVLDLLAPRWTEAFITESLLKKVSTNFPKVSIPTSPGAVSQSGVLATRNALVRSQRARPDASYRPLTFMDVLQVSSSQGACPQMQP